MAKQTWVELFAGATSDASSEGFDHFGSTQGIYVVGVLGDASLILEARLPKATDLNAPDTWVPVVNGEWRQSDMYATEYSVSGDTAFGMMKTLNSISAQYRMRLVGSDANTAVWAYMTRN